MIDWTTSKWSDKALSFINKPIKDFKKITLLYGSVRSSKTVNMLIKLLELLEYVNNKGVVALIGVTKDTVYDNILCDLFDTVGDANYKYNRTTGDLVVNGYKCKVIGAKDKGSEKYLRGKTLAGAYIDELTLIPYEFFKQLINRCSIKDSKIFATTNPDSPNHWVYKDFINEAKKESIFESWHFLLGDNLNLDPQYIEDVKASYSGVFYDRMIKGLFVVAEGLLIPEFNPETHIINEYDLKDYKEFIGGVDWGFANPMAAAVIGITRDNKFHMLSEFYEKNKLTSDVITWFKQKEVEIGKKLNYIFIDSAEPDRQVEMVNAGLSAYLSDKSILTGLNCVKTKFKNNEIKIHNSCINTQNELQTCRHAQEGETGYGNDKYFIGDDHALDGCLRYPIYTYTKQILGL